MEQTLLQLEEDGERFRKLQLSDQTNFEDRLDGLQVSLRNTTKFYQQTAYLI